MMLTIAAAGPHPHTTTGVEEAACMAYIHARPGSAIVAALSCLYSFVNIDKYNMRCSDSNISLRPSLAAQHHSGHAGNAPTYTRVMHSQCPVHANQAEVLWQQQTDSQLLLQRACSSNGCRGMRHKQVELVLSLNYKGLQACSLNPKVCTRAEHECLPTTPRCL